MGEVISEEQPRIKFETRCEGEVIIPSHPELLHLARLQGRLEELGVIPILNDGLVGGNCAMRAPEPTQTPAAAAATGATAILVSKSGKAPLVALRPEDFVLLMRFDRATWSAAYKSAAPGVRPSSDSPLHAAALSPDCCQRYGWGRAPRVAVHGHALAEGAQLEAAAAAGLPISPAATLFSTPEDLEALEEIFTSHPYPEHRCYCRRGHGFFLLGDTAADAEAALEASVLPLLRV